METYGILDTRVPDNNLGNYIIMESVIKNLRSIFANDFFILIPAADDFGKVSLSYICDSKLVFVGGTNCLNSNMDSFRQIGLTRRNSVYLKNKLILLGCGWWQYQSEINDYTEEMLREVLKGDYYHSVRDQYTKDKLSSIGVSNVINTGCPTVWGVTDDICESIRKNKSTAEGGSVLICLTDYNRNKNRDMCIINIAQKNYKNIYAWVQGPSDYVYFKSLCPEVRIIPPRLDCLISFLDSVDVDYIGTRLHAGILCIQKGKRSIIIEIDNRAKEMARDINLPTISESLIDESLEEMINSSFETRINIPIENINEWINQFV